MDETDQLLAAHNIGLLSSARFQVKRYNTSKTFALYNASDFSTVTRLKLSNCLLGESIQLALYDVLLQLFIPTLIIYVKEPLSQPLKLL
jgi:hypothetical protein